MPSVQLPLLLLCLTSCGVCFNGGHLLPDESENMGESSQNDILQRSESLILQSVLKKKEEHINKDTVLPVATSVEDQTPGLQETAQRCLKQPGAQGPSRGEESNAPLLQWLSKRQHPGKNYLSNLEKRQHPGKRDVEEETSYGDTQKRQHPGKREMADDHDVSLKLKRQQPLGRKSLLNQFANSPKTQLTYLNELSKGKYPDRRYMIYKHQHPSKRGWNYEVDLYSEKRQHPGKRHWSSDSSDYTGPCNFQESFTCHKGSLLHDLVEDVSRDRVEEKQQHPGKISAWESETEE